MSDQKRWFKVWTSILADPCFSCLPPDDVGRWVRLGAATALSGNNGTIVGTAEFFSKLLSCQNDIERIIKRLPNVEIKNSENDNGKLAITMLNWTKYQEDSTIAARMRKYRIARKKISGLPRKYAESIWKRDQYQCVYCGLDLKQFLSEATIDHVIPLSRGGSNKAENLASCCGNCNMAKNDYTPDEINYTINFGDVKALRDEYRNALNNNIIQQHVNYNKLTALRSKMRGDKIKIRKDTPPSPSNNFMTNSKEILKFLNQKANKNFTESKINLDFIINRLKEGGSPVQCRQIIVKKVREWGTDERMSVCLRPATLFNKTKFNQYIGELVAPTGEEDEDA